MVCMRRLSLKLKNEDLNLIVRSYIGTKIQRMIWIQYAMLKTPDLRGLCITFYNLYRLSKIFN